MYNYYYIQLINLYSISINDQTLKHLMYILDFLERIFRREIIIIVIINYVRSITTIGKIKDLLNHLWIVSVFKRKFNSLLSECLILLRRLNRSELQYQPLLFMVLCEKPIIQNKIKLRGEISSLVRREQLWGELQLSKVFEEY